MASSWYYAHDENKFGPFSPAQLKDLADAGTILPVDTVWKEGREKGVLASRVKNLFSLPKFNVAQDTPIPGNTRSVVESESLPLQANAKSTSVAPGLETAPAESIPIVATAPDNAAPAVVAENDSSMPEGKAVAPQALSKSQQRPASKGRAIALKGADIVDQDGTRARYRMKCTECGQKDSACHTIPIANRLTKSNFFCPKCRKRRDVAIQCSSH
jgi:GYF domain 2